MTEKIRNLLVRAASGVVLLGVVLGAAFVGPLGYSALLLLITGVGVWEFYALARAKGVEPQRGLGLVGSLGLTLTGASILCVNYLDYYYEVFILLGIAIAALAIMFTFVVEVFRNRQTPIHNIATTIMGMVYVGLPMAVMSIIPMLLQNPAWTDPYWNAWYFLCYLFLVWGNDVFAYLVGISIGKHKMCERLSPKKSWEGFFGGVIGSLAMGALGAYIVEGNYIMWIGLALVVSLSSVVGDLAESMFKRDAGVKDSGAFIPGHGGMLDRFDALIFSAPFAFLYLIIANILLIA